MATAPGSTGPVIEEAAENGDVAGVNPLDHVLRSGLVPGLDGGRPFPRVLGMEAAGIVLARGEDVDGLEVGDAVFGFALTGGGTYAETTVLSAPNTARIPEGLSATVAATLPVAGTTAVDAYLLGYDDTNSFYRAFRAWIGTTPDSLRTAATAGA